MTAPTHYQIHDAIYKHRRRDGRYPGWAAPEVYELILPEWERIIDSADLDLNLPALDLGCGAGQITRILASKGLNCIGMDISETAIEWARENIEEMSSKASFFCGDLTAPETFANYKEYFGSVVDSHFLHCIIGNHRKQLLDQVYSVLKNGGKFVVNTMIFRDGKIPKGEYWQKHYDETTKTQIQNGISTRFIASQNHIISELMDARFCIQHVSINPGAEDDEMDLDTLVVIAKKLESV